jgi:hypothetical protein
MVANAKGVAEADAIPVGGRVADGEGSAVPVALGMRVSERMGVAC